MLIDPRRAGVSPEFPCHWPGPAPAPAEWPCLLLRIRRCSRCHARSPPDSAPAMTLSDAPRPTRQTYPVTCPSHLAQTETVKIYPPTVKAFWYLPVSVHMHSKYKAGYKRGPTRAMARPSNEVPQLVLASELCAEAMGVGAM